MVEINIEAHVEESLELERQNILEDTDFRVFAAVCKMWPQRSSLNRFECTSAYSTGTKRYQRPSVCPKAKAKLESSE